MATSGRTLKLQSNDGDIFEVDEAILRQSALLRGFSNSTIH